MIDAMGSSRDARPNVAKLSCSDIIIVIVQSNNKGKALSVVKVGRYVDLVGTDRWEERGTFLNI
jgi:hypothetical protein